MPEPLNRDLPASLLANTTWMHALARQLVGGEEGAEDLVQETWLRVLRRGPRDPGRAKGWLATVLRNVSVSKARAEGRRAAREREVASREAIESTADVIERVAVHQEVIDAVMELEEPYRRTILMRYFDGLPPREIARREAAPVDTVKGRLARGLERLKRALDSSHGEDRRAWVVLLMPLARCGEIEAVAGASAFGLGVKPAAAVAALLLIAFGVHRLGLAPDAGEIPEVVEGWKDGSLGGPNRVPVEVEAFVPAEDPSPPEPAVVVAEGARDASRPRVARLDPPPLGSEWWTEEGPPGLVRIPGGRTQVGTRFEDLIELLEENPQLRKHASGFLAEVPRHEVDVEDFYLMVTEVTNEQYEVYVRATGVRPPHSWGEKAISEGRDRYLEEQIELRKRAQREGRAVSALVPFDASEWWAKNWETSEWEVTEELKKVPVVVVDYPDARGYAEWAGLRLVDENEFERAVRGPTDRLYPWGDGWQPDKYAATNEIRGVSELFPVGSFPAGASDQAVFDLAGNVWEWTSSRFMPYPGWKHRVFELGEGSGRTEVDTIPSWSPDRRVVKGGSQQNNRFYSRCTTRGGFDRYQKASAFGFRCAASARPGVDCARTCLDEIPREIRPMTEDGPVTFDTGKTVALCRWNCTVGTSGPPGYQVITGHDHVLLIPASEFQTDLSSETEGALDSLGYPSSSYPGGVLSSDVDLVEPDLGAGTYLLMLRPRGGGGERELRFDVEFVDMTGEVAATLPGVIARYANPVPSSVRVVDRSDGQGRAVRWLALEVFLPGEIRRGIRLTLNLCLEEGVLEEGWR